MKQISILLIAAVCILNIIIHSNCFADDSCISSVRTILDSETNYLSRVVTERIYNSQDFPDLNIEHEINQVIHTINTELLSDSKYLKVIEEDSINMDIFLFDRFVAGNNSWVYTDRMIHLTLNVSELDYTSLTHELGHSIESHSIRSYLKKLVNKKVITQKESDAITSIEAFSRYEEVSSIKLYHTAMDEVFADLVATLYSDDPLIMVKGLSKSRVLDIDDVKITPRSFLNSVDNITTTPGPEFSPHNYGSPIRHWLYKNWIKPNKLSKAEILDFYFEAYMDFLIKFPSIEDQIDVNNFIEEFIKILASKEKA